MKYILIALTLFTACKEPHDHSSFYERIRDEHAKYYDLRNDSNKLKEALAELRYRTAFPRLWNDVNKLCRNEQITAHINDDSSTIIIILKK